MDENVKKEIEELSGKIEQIESTLSSAKKILYKLENEYLKTDYTQIEGIVGEFDGKDMVTKEGKKYEVPANYAAKSKLTYGDVLKLIEEDGKKLFKQIERVNREKIEGILTKKEGEWWLLTDRGSYEVSDAAAEYQKAQLNSQATAYLPADNLDAPFAALDEVVGASVIETKKEIKKEEKSTKGSTPKKGQAKKKTDKKEEDIKDLSGKEMDLKEERKPAKAGTAGKEKSKPKPKPKTTRKTKPKPEVKTHKSRGEDGAKMGSKKRSIIDKDDLI